MRWRLLSRAAKSRRISSRNLRWRAVVSSASAFEGVRDVFSGGGEGRWCGVGLRREELLRRRWETRWKGRSSTARVRVKWRASGGLLVGI